LERRYRFSTAGVVEVMPDGTERPVTGTEFRHREIGVSVSEMRRMAEEALLAHYESEHADVAQPDMDNLEIVVEDTTTTAA
jgi:hypothetical protein